MRNVMLSSIITGASFETRQCSSSSHGAESTQHCEGMATEGLNAFNECFSTYLNGVTELLQCGYNGEQAWCMLMCILVNGI